MSVLAETVQAETVLPETVLPGTARAGFAAGPSLPLLAPFVSAIGYAESRYAHARELALPSAAMQLLVNLDADTLHSYDAGHPARFERTAGAALQGPATRPAMIDPAEQRAVVWVCFRLAGAAPFFAAPASEARDQLVDLAELWGGEARLLRERLLAAATPAEKIRTMEAALGARAPAGLEADPAVTFAAAALHRGRRVAEVADRLGWTPRRLARRFTERVGVAPKRFARVRRFQRLLAAAAGQARPDWARLAADCGYHDQPHLIHEFREFAGMTPAGYTPRSPAERNHVPLPG